MSQAPAIEVDRIAKQYRLGGLATVQSTLRESIARGVNRCLGRSPDPDAPGRPAARTGDNARFWALRDVSFSVAPGECLGVIGRNGAGKSTLLKVLSRITAPTEGTVRLRGRVGSLLEVGTGFHPELTGRENVYLNGSVLGMRRPEVKRKFDEIVDFAGVEKFLDTPVKRYSSGMTVRLAFAVAAHLEPEVMLIDEVLAVGDAAFQRRCLGKMSDVAESAQRTILFVSHNMAAVSKLCARSVLLDGGTVADIGPTDRIIRGYFARLESRAQQALAARTDRKGTGSVRVTGVTIRDARTGRPLNVAVSGQDIDLDVSYAALTHGGDRLRSVNLGLAFHTELGQFITALNSQVASRAFDDLPDRGVVRCRVPRLPMMYGNYRINVTLQADSELVDQVEHAATLEVQPGDYYGTGRPHRSTLQGLYVPQAWSVLPADASDPAPGDPACDPDLTTQATLQERAQAA